MGARVGLTERDEEAIDAFRNFLSWQVPPYRYDGHRRTTAHFQTQRDVPPAWFAYALGLTSWCPPAGTL